MLNVRFLDRLTGRPTADLGRKRSLDRTSGITVLILWSNQGYRRHVERWPHIDPRRSHCANRQRYRVVGQDLAINLDLDFRPEARSLGSCASLFTNDTLHPVRRLFLFVVCGGVLQSVLAYLQIIVDHGHGENNLNGFRQALQVVVAVTLFVGVTTFQHVNVRKPQSRQKTPGSV